MANLYVVTGTSRGLGLALAVAIARDPDNELIALARAGDAPAGGTLVRVDLADTASLETACDRIDAIVRGKSYAKAVLINNAGVVMPVGPIDQVDARELEANLVVNLVAPMLLMRRFLRATEGIAPVRRIVNISSGAGRRPLFGWSAYCAAKAGLDMATRVVGLEAAQRGSAVEAVSLAPGVIDTGMQAQVRSMPAAAFVDVERFRRMHSEGDLRDPDAVAADILRAEASGKLTGDPVLDLRSL